MQNDVTLHVIKQAGWFFTFVKNRKTGTFIRTLIIISFELLNEQMPT